ncbi:unnamed protein product [Orchesella dallaii]|uniref:Uncharacterized protein n=1 Tax=Orchesella dallaii TaxID=48710 RepID=A0ABP1QSV8_9HEXA
MGINNTMCNWKEGHENFLQPVAQALYFYLDPEKFEIAAATGAQLNNNEAFKASTGLHKSSTNNNDEPSGNSPGGRYRSAISEDEEDIDLEETINPAKHLDLVGDQIHAEKITFDRPFYWYLKDEVVGPVFTGLVNSFKTYREQVVAVEEAFDDMYKYQFWSCGPKHLALMDEYNNAIETQEDEEDIGLADGLEDTEVTYDENEQ